MDITSESLLKQGRLAEVLQAAAAQVRSAPADAGQRVFLFQLLALLGQWERAENQLVVAGELDPRHALMVNAYGVALRGERERAAVMAGLRSPVMAGEPAAWQAKLLQSLQSLRQGRHEQAAQWRGQAFDEAEAVRGNIDGAPFAWIADADPRFGPCLELILKSGYVWAPFAQIRELRFTAPTGLRDMVWAPVQVTWRNGGEAAGFVPCRYPGSELAADSDLVLGRRTDWSELGSGGFAGSGQRMLATEAGEYPLLDVRTLSLESA